MSRKSRSSTSRLEPPSTVGSRALVALMGAAIAAVVVGLVVAFVLSVFVPGAQRIGARWICDAGETLELGTSGHGAEQGQYVECVDREHGRARDVELRAFVVLWILVAVGATAFFWPILFTVAGLPSRRRRGPPAATPKP